MSDPQIPAQPDPTQNPTQPLPQFAAPAPQPVPAQPQPAQPAVQQPPVEQPVPQQPVGPYTATATLPPPPVPPTYAAVPAPPPPHDPARGRRVALGVGAGLAGVLLLVAGIGIGRVTAPKGPESLVDAVRMAQQGTLPCGSAAQGGVGGFIVRLCQQAPGQGGPGLPRGFGGNSNGNGNGGGGGFGNGNGTGNGTGQGSGA